MSHTGQSLARGRLRLAWAPGAASARHNRALLWLQALLVAALLRLTGAALWIIALVALVPVVLRRAPLGRRLRPAQREARVIPLRPAQPAVPR